MIYWRVAEVIRRLSMASEGMLLVILMIYQLGDKILAWYRPLLKCFHLSIASQFLFTNHRQVLEYDVQSRIDDCQ